jgi:hypothetical protein
MIATILLYLGVLASTQVPAKQTFITTTDPIPDFRKTGFAVNPEVIAMVAKIKLDHQLNKEEASAIANAYRENSWGSCGMNSEPIDHQDEWVVNPRVGYSAEPAPAIIINKKTGKISCDGAKSFNSLLEFVAHLLTLRSSRTQPAQPGFPSRVPSFITSFSYRSQVGSA